MPFLHRYKIFISHAWKYGGSYDRIIEFLDAANNLIYSNYSIPWEKRFEGLYKYQLEDELRDQIRPVEVVLIIGGMYVSYSNWIQFEIDFAKELGKPIIGIKPWNGQRMPDAVTNASDIIVGWNTPTIVQAIRDYSL